MGLGVTQNVRRVRVVSVPRRHEVRFRQQARFILVLAVTLAVTLAVYATTNGYAEFTPVIVAIGVVPLLGGLIGLWRLVAAWEAGPGRQHAVVAAFSLALVSWAFTLFIYLIARVGAARVPLFRRRAQLRQRPVLDHRCLAPLRRGR
jgi:drug/metabolite transporter (DMT)-like permease